MAEHAFGSGTVDFVIVDAAGKNLRKFRVSGPADVRRFFALARGPRGERPAHGPYLHRVLTRRERALLGAGCPASVPAADWAEFVAPLLADSLESVKRAA